MKVAFAEKGRAIVSLPFLLVCLAIMPALAQNESGKRIISRTAFASHWYDSVKHFYLLRAPIIRTLPPLSTDMPANVLKGYIHLDSLARFNDNGGLLQYSSAWIEEPELFKKTLASYYTVMDYDPLRYQQYDYETALKSWMYKSELGGTTSLLPRALTEAATIQSEREALRAILFPDYVLRVKVLSVDSIFLELPMGSHYIFNVVAQVLDTLKGQKFITCQEQNGGNQSQVMPMSALPCLYFQYNSSTYNSYGIPNKKADSVFIDGRRKFAMHPGQEAVVFLHFSEQKFDSTHDAFELFLGPPGSDASLPIVNGQVRDVNRIWSNEATMTYADWRRRFLELRDKIINGNY